MGVSQLKIEANCDQIETFVLEKESTLSEMGLEQ